MFEPLLMLSNTVGPAYKHFNAIEQLAASSMLQLALWCISNL